MKFEIKDQKDIEILELITYRIADRLCYDVRNDLTRNHITKKNDDELIQEETKKIKQISTHTRQQILFDKQDYDFKTENTYC